MAKLKVLYVEDYPVVQMMYAEALKEAFDLDMVSDGKQALQKLVSHNYDLIIMDLLIPGVSGFDLLEKYRSQSPNGSTQVIVLSDFDDERTLNRLKELGVEQCWMKVNTTPDELIYKIQKLLQK